MRRNRPERGMAIVLVLMVVAVAAVLGWAMLATASIRSRTADNAVDAAAADRLAESGVNLGLYLVRNPSIVPTLESTGSYSVSGLGLGGSGTYGLSLTRRANPQQNTFDLIATGNADSGARNRVAATLVRQQRFVVRSAATLNTSLTVTSGSRFLKGSTGGPLPGISASALTVAGQVSINAGGMVTGDVAATSVSPVGSVAGLISAVEAVPQAPTWGQIRQYGPTYTHNGISCTATVIGGALNGPLPPTDPVTNPLGIYYCPGDLTLLDQAAGATTIDVSGSIVVAGKLSLGALGNNVVRTLNITPLAGAPGLVVGNELLVVGPYKRVQVNGLLYTQNGINGSGAATTATRLTVNGAWLCFTGPFYGGKNWGAHPLYSGNLYVTYVPANVNVADFTSVTNQVTAGVAMTGFAAAP